MAFVSTTTLSNQVITSYVKVGMFALRALPVFDPFAKVRPGDVTNPGSPVSFTFWTDMTAATSALTETTDITPVALADSRVTVTPAEHGNGILTTIKIRKDTYVASFDSDAANLVAWNMVDSIDTLARNALDGGTNVEYVGQTAEASITASNIITADLVRKKKAELDTANAMPFDGDFYAAIHPAVAYDLKGETGDGAWVSPAQYVNTEKLYNNEIGKFGGFRFVETSRAKLNADGGSGAVDTYTTYFIGKEALAKAETIPPALVLGPVTDYLKRWQPLGWYGYLGYDTLREAALERLVSASSIGANT